MVVLVMVPTRYNRTRSVSLIRPFDAGPARCLSLSHFTQFTAVELSDEPTPGLTFPADILAGADTTVRLCSVILRPYLVLVFYYATSSITLNTFSVANPLWIDIPQQGAKMSLPSRDRRST